MPTTIPNLWPEQFKVDVQTPLIILRVQANSLEKVTRGILEGMVETESAKDKVQHRLVVVAPGYGGYRHTLIKVIHTKDFPYPAEVQAEVLVERVKREERVINEPDYFDRYPTAYSDDDMQELVRKVLQSGPTIALITSLIAKSNEAKEPQEVG